MQIRVITPEEGPANEVEVVNELFRNGLDVLHLRKPAFTIAETGAYLARIDEQYLGNVVVHQYYTLFHKLHLKGIHLSSHQREKPDMWKTIEDIPAESVSTSYHGWNEIREADRPYGAVFISPLFNSISKPGYNAATPPNGILTLKEDMRKTGQHLPAIIGLGGISAANVLTLKDLGYDGVALLGAIWQAKDALAAFKEIAAITKQDD